MPEKWNEPRGPAPSWLDESREVTGHEPKLSPAAFNATVIEQLVRDVGLPVWQALEVAANSHNETGCGRAYRANNLGGWKITAAGARAYESVRGRKPRWWRAPGNKAPGATLKDLKGGDPPWCWYWGFDTVGEYLSRWVSKFVPKPKPTDTRAALEPKREQTGNYRLTGFLFWDSDPTWFIALCDAGYKGQRTDDDPQPSYEGHRSLVRWARVHYAQARLPGDLVVDGAWGPKSDAACRTYQRAKGLPVTGEPDDATLAALIATQET